MRCFIGNRINTDSDDNHRERIDVFCPTFGQFRDIGEHPPVPFIEIVCNCITALLERYDNESKRKHEIMSHFGEMINHLQLDYYIIEEYEVPIPGKTDKRTSSKIDMVVSSKSTQELNHIPEVLMEIKNEFGATNNEPVVQLSNNYCKCVGNYLTQSHSCINLNPTFLLIITGSSLFLYGAITTKTAQSSNLNIFLDLIDSIHLDQKILDVITISTFFWKLFKFIKQLSEERVLHDKHRYSSIIPIPILKQPLQKSDTIGRVGKKLVFVNSSKVFKFVYHCNFREAFEAAVINNISPKFAIQKLHNNLYLLSMELVKGKTLGELLNLTNEGSRDNLKVPWGNFLDGFAKFSSSYVHGDIRSCNIIYGALPDSVEEKFYLIDFDWANSKTQGFYPIDINSDIHWPNGVEKRKPITDQHDYFWLKEHTTLLFGVSSLSKFENLKYL
jgi:hypothetical protein